MTLNKIKRLRAKIDLQREKGGIKPAVLENLAKACGRERSKRGNEPNWINPEFKKLYPLSIPHHGELNRYTARSILNQLEADLDHIEDSLQVRDQGGKK